MSNNKTILNKNGKQQINDPRMVVETTPASKKITTTSNHVVVDLTSSPSSVRSRSPIDSDHNQQDIEDDEQFSPQRPTNKRMNGQRRAAFRKDKQQKPTHFHLKDDNEVQILSSSPSSSSLTSSPSVENDDDQVDQDQDNDSFDDQSEPEQVEDGIIGMRIRTPGRRST